MYFNIPIQLLMTEISIIFAYCFPYLKQRFYLSKNIYITDFTFDRDFQQYYKTVCSNSTCF